MVKVGSAAAGRVGRVVVFALVVRVALLVVPVLCVDALQESESLKTRPGSMSESPPLESYDSFREMQASEEQNEHFPEK